MATYVVTTAQKENTQKKLVEIHRQIFLQKEYAFDPDLLIAHLQCGIEGKFAHDAKLELTPAQAVNTFQFSCTFKAANTNLNEAITLAERFALQVHGINNLNLREQFDFPEYLPWGNVLVIYDPGLNNRQSVEKSLQGQKLKVYEERNVMEYSGAEAGARPTVCIIENSLRPTEDTMGKTPDQLRADGRPYLDLRGYALGFGLRYFDTKDYLDSETWVWFPENRLPSGGVAFGSWDPDVDFRQVKFYWRGSGHSLSFTGARLAMFVPCKLKT